MTLRHAKQPRAARDAGFSLMELLVVMSIFSTVVLIASDVFLISTRTQRKIYAFERAQGDARYTMEAITREVRSGEIDYAYYATRNPALGSPDSELALLQSDLTPIRFKLSDTSTQNLCPDGIGPCLLVTVGSGTAQAVTPKNVIVRTAKFYIQPLADPTILDAATGLYSSNIQPRVTIVLTLQSKAVDTAEQSTVYLQTTATSRAYKR